jgi:hypothetical protein
MKTHDAIFLQDDELRRLPDKVIAQLSRRARQRAKALRHVPHTDDMIQMLDDLTSAPPEGT